MSETKEAMKEYVLPSRRGPVVRFTGVLLAHTELPQCWAIYRTKGNNYVVAHEDGPFSDAKDFKKAKLVVSYFKTLATRERQNSRSPRDWSPRADYGVSEPIAKLILAAGKEISQHLVQDVE